MENRSWYGKCFGCFIKAVFGMLGHRGQKNTKEPLHWTTEVISSEFVDKQNSKRSIYIWLKLKFLIFFFSITCKQLHSRMWIGPSVPHVSANLKHCVPWSTQTIQPSGQVRPCFPLFIVREDRKRESFYPENSNTRTLVLVISNFIGAHDVVEICHHTINFIRSSNHHHQNPHHPSVMTIDHFRKLTFLIKTNLYQSIKNYPVNLKQLLL